MNILDKLREDEVVIRRALENPLFHAQMLAIANDWINENSNTEVFFEADPLAQEAYFKAVLYERTGQYLGLEGY